MYHTRQLDMVTNENLVRGMVRMDGMSAARISWCELTKMVSIGRFFGLVQE